MINRKILPSKFKYRTSEYNVRYGFPEEKIQHIEQVYNRIDYWKGALVQHLQPNQKLILGFSQTGVDVFAIILAALELDIHIDLLDKDSTGDLLIHNLPDVLLDQINIKIKSFNHFDIADNPTISKIKYQQQGYALIQGKTQDYVGKYIQRHKFTSNVLHTRCMSSPNYLVEVLLPALASDSANMHMCMGYYNIEEGTGKLVEVVNKHGIDCILLPQAVDVYAFSKIAIAKGVDLKKLKVYTMKNNSMHLFAQDSQIIDVDPSLKLFPLTIGINGHLIYDSLNQKLYLMLLENLPAGVADIKIKTLNRIVSNKYGLEISAARYFGGNNDYALDLFRLTS